MGCGMHCVPVCPVSHYYVISLKQGQLREQRSGEALGAHLYKYAAVHPGCTPGQSCFSAWGAPLSRVHP